MASTGVGFPAPEAARQTVRAMKGMMRLPPVANSGSMFAAVRRHHIASLK